jgi:hypothetical protein
MIKGILCFRFHYYYIPYIQQHEHNYYNSVYVFLLQKHVHKYSIYWYIV